MQVVVGTTPDAHLYRWFVDDEEVTDRCFAADDSEGWADCYRINTAGTFYADRMGRDTARERLHGSVRLVRKATDG